MRMGGAHRWSVLEAGTECALGTDGGFGQQEASEDQVYFGGMGSGQGQGSPRGESWGWDSCNQ